jgi:formate hydrogenlyase transcriptional activator
MGPSATVSARLKAVLKANEAALTKLTSEEVFIGMCRALKAVVSYDRAGLTVYEPEHDSLKIAALYGRYKDSFFHVGDLLARKSTQNGWTFENKSKTIRRDLPNDFRFASERQTAEEGFRSLCSVPLVVRGSSIGVVTVVGARKNQFSLTHAELVQEMSNQIALAISSFTARCPTHATSRLVCPRCIGAAGGKTTVAKHRDALSIWGKKGGRSRRNVNFLDKRFQ